MKNILYSIVMLFGLVISLVAQDVPRVISYQGVLVGEDGKPVNQTGATVKISFYNAESSGNALSSTSYTVNIIGGLFSTIITIPPASAMDLNQQLWLEVEYSGIQYKRVQLAASLYALNIANNVVTEKKIASNAVTSAKIKNGEVKAEDLHDMGANDNEVLKWKNSSNSWVPSQDEGLRTVSVNSPLTGDGTSANPLNVSVPSGVPIGTIVAYMGDGSDLTNLESEGWYLCDGRLIEDLNGLNNNQKIYLEQLFSRAGNLNPNNLPDLRGMFLRGANVNNGTTVGQFQDFSTAMPKNMFQIGYGGLHSHTTSLFMSNDGSYHYHVAGGSDDTTPFITNPSNKFNPIGSSFDGEHTHLIYGGDDETRPANVSINYIIKAR